MYGIKTPILICLTVVLHGTWKFTNRNVTLDRYQDFDIHVDMI